MEQHRCDKCKALLAVGRVEAGAIQIKCKRCGFTKLILPERKAA